MNGALHYEEAERLLNWVEAPPADPPASPTEFIETIQMAQVHATLALAAAQATGRCAAPDDLGYTVVDDWIRVLR